MDGSGFYTISLTDRLSWKYRESTLSSIVGNIIGNKISGYEIREIVNDLQLGKVWKVSKRDIVYFPNRFEFTIVDSINIVRN